MISIIVVRALGVEIALHHHFAGWGVHLMKPINRCTVAIRHHKLILHAHV